MSLWKLQGLQNRHRQNHDDNIGQDVQARIREPQSFLIEAVARDTVIPELGHWDAVQPRREDCPRAIES